MKLPINTDLTNKVAVVTGAGGVLCGMFAKALAASGARVAVLDLNLEAAEKGAGEITAENGKAIAYKCNVLDKDSMEECRQAVLKDLGKCDILINGIVNTACLFALEFCCGCIAFFNSVALNRIWGIDEHLSLGCFHKSEIR